MPYMGTLNSGQPAAIKFAADAGNSGTTVVVCTWLGGNGTPKVPVLEIAPAANQSTNVVVPICDLLQINVHLPPGGHGTLTVSQGDKVTEKPITEDSVWVLLV